MKRVLCLPFLILSLYAATPPSKVIKTNGMITDMVVKDNKIYVSTDAHGVEIFDESSLQKVGVIKIPNIKNSDGKLIPSKIYSLDHESDTTVMVAESGGVFRDVYLNKGDKTIKIIDTSRGLLIKKVRFLDPGHLLFGLPSDTIVRMDISKNAIEYQSQAGGGVFRDMVLSPAKTLVSVADEGGVITMMDVRNGRKVKILGGMNVDNINRIDHKHDVIISGGQDRRVGIYRAKGSYFLNTDFFVYAVGLTPSAQRGVYTDGSENELQVFDTTTKAKIARLKGGDVIFDNLIFLDEHRLIGSGEENKFYYWRVP